METVIDYSGAVTKEIARQFRDLWGLFLESPETFRAYVIRVT